MTPDTTLLTIISLAGSLAILYRSDQRFNNTDQAHARMESNLKALGVRQKGLEEDQRGIVNGLAGTVSADKA